jgi:hypothetical protein
MLEWLFLALPTSQSSSVSAGVEQITDAGGTMADSELFNVYYEKGGMTETASIQLITDTATLDLTIEQVVDDFNVRAYAPTTNFLPGESYTLVINDA